MEIFMKKTLNSAAPSRDCPGCGAAGVWSLRKTPYWIDENTFYINDNVKFEYNTDLLNKLDIL